MTIHSGMAHLQGHLICAMDYETTGVVAGYHEIIQIGLVPLNSDLRPNTDIRPFYHHIAPDHPERQGVGGAGVIHNIDLNWLVANAPSKERVADMLVDWFEKLNLAVKRKIVPLAHNYEFEAAFSRAWLGYEMFNDLFHWQARDGMREAIVMKDRAHFAGEKMPFNRVGLEALCEHFGIINENPHDALGDSYAEAEVYRCLLLHGM